MSQLAKAEHFWETSRQINLGPLASFSRDARSEIPKTEQIADGP